MWRDTGRICKSKETGPINHDGEFRAVFVKAIKKHHLEKYYLVKPDETEKEDPYLKQIPEVIENDEILSPIDRFENAMELSYEIEDQIDIEASAQNADLAESLIETLDDLTRLVIEEVFYEFDGDTSEDTFDDIYSKYQDDELFKSPKHAQSLYNEGINRLIIYTQEQNIEP